MSITVRLRKPRDQSPDNIEVVDGHGRVVRTITLVDDDIDAFREWMPLVRSLMRDAYQQGRKDLREAYRKLLEIHS